VLLLDEDVAVDAVAVFPDEAVTDEDPPVDDVLVDDVLVDDGFAEVLLASHAATHARQKRAGNENGESFTRAV